MSATTPLNKLCQTADFAVLQPYLAQLGAPHTPGGEHRKHWEWALTLKTFAECVPPGARRALGVGAGVDPATFWLTNHCEQVHATDLYAAAGGWSEAAPRMLLDPAPVYGEFPWNPRRLIVQHMDGRALRYEDATFDFVYSSSSIEHFGDFADVARAMLEIARVVKPGGVVSLSTEFKLAGPGRGFRNVLTFDVVELCALIEACGLRLIDELDLTPDGGAVHSFARVLEDHDTSGAWTPHITLEFEGYLWTSVHLALRRPFDAADTAGVGAADWLRRNRPRLRERLPETRPPAPAADYGIPSGYRHRSTYTHFDDTPNRDEWQDDVYRFARQLLEPHGQRRVLDVGCGSAFKLLKYFGDCATVGTDLEPTLRWLRNTYPDRDWRVSDFAASIEGAFDLVLCVDVIEHLVEPDRLLAWLDRIDWRYLVLSTPDRDALVETLGAPAAGPPLNPAHVREWNRAEFARYIGAWFPVVQQEPADNCGQILVASRTLLPSAAAV